MLSDIILWEHRYNIHGSSTAVNVLLNNSCAQKGNKFIDNKNLKQEHLGIKQLYLDSEGNCLFERICVSISKVIECSSLQKILFSLKNMQLELKLGLKTSRISNVNISIFGLLKVSMMFYMT